MKVIIYLDLIILENFCMNFIILFTVGKVMSKKLVYKRIFLASLIGAIYTFSLCLNLSTILLNMSKIIFLIIMVIVAFKIKSLKEIFVDALVCLCISFIFSGAAIAFVNFMNPKVVYMINGMILSGKSLLEVLLFSVIIGFILILGTKGIVKFSKKLLRKDMIAKVGIYFYRKCVTVNAFVDTGNLLVEPCSGDSVVIVEKNELRQLFNEFEWNKINKILSNSELNEEFDIVEGEINLIPIPYISLGNHDGILYAFRSDFIKVNYNGEESSIPRSLIGVYDGRLTENHKYSALIGLKLFERSNDVEFNTKIKVKSKCSVC